MKRSISQQQSEEYQRKVQALAYLLWQFDNDPHKPSVNYWQEAEEKLSRVQWQFWHLNKPLIWLEKKVIEPLNQFTGRVERLADNDYENHPFNQPPRPGM